MNTEENIKRFEELTLSVQREGMDKLLNYVRKSDFYRAPSSTKFHLSCEGGLLQHSLNVYDCLQAKKQNPTWAEILSGVKEENLIIMSLFHDLCKVNFYKTDKRNQKINGEWVEVPYYTIEEKFAFGGHGGKSVFLVQQFMKLKTDEAAAINCHMGATPGGDAVRDSANAFQSYAISWIVHVADEAATYLLKR